MNGLDEYEVSPYEVTGYESSEAESTVRHEDNSVIIH